MAGGRGERVDFIDFLDQGQAPNEEGMMQRNGNDLLIFLNGSAQSALTGTSVPATEVGQVLYSVDGSTFTAEHPLTSCNGWLTNDNGEHLVVG